MVATFKTEFFQISYFMRFAALILRSLLVFRTSQIVYFYVAFELSLIPITLIIMGWGYQPERLAASMALILYTITSSLPLLVTLILLAKLTTPSFFLVSPLMSLGSRARASIIIARLSLAFFVKLPMFLTHMWLPKAHVEAPVSGSIFLAAVLLKLGGMGLFRFMGFYQVNRFFCVIMRICLTGVVWVGLICTFNTDIKTIIAYSSVAHMALALAVVYSFRLEGRLAAALIFLTHGASSSFIFMQSFFLYTRCGTRSILLVGGSLWWSGLFAVMWFIACIGMMGAPPTANILGEVATMIILVHYSRLAIGFLIAGAFLAGAYSIFLFSFVYHTKKSKKMHLIPFHLIESRAAALHLYWLLGSLVVINWFFIYFYMIAGFYFRGGSVRRAFTRWNGDL